jgi:folate-binding protein YgfZ
MPAPHHRFSHVHSGGCTVAALSATGARGSDHGAARRKEEIATRIEGAGAIAASPEDAERARIENFVPKYGCDITEHTLPQETQQMHALHFQKGCYLGQEIVERIRSRGHVNKVLMGFRAQFSVCSRAGREADAGRKACGRSYLGSAGGRGCFWTGLCESARCAIGRHGGDGWRRG